MKLYTVEWMDKDRGYQVSDPVPYKEAFDFAEIQWKQAGNEATINFVIDTAKKSKKK